MADDPLTRSRGLRSEQHELRSRKVLHRGSALFSMIRNLTTDYTESTDEFSLMGRSFARHGAQPLSNRELWRRAKQHHRWI